jgi:hypothetical protein
MTKNVTRATELWGNLLKLHAGAVMLLCISGDGNVSFEEFVEIVSNMGAAANRTADQEEKELRDAFRVGEEQKQILIFSNDKVHYIHQHNNFIAIRCFQCNMF